MERPAAALTRGLRGAAAFCSRSDHDQNSQRTRSGSGYSVKPVSTRRRRSPPAIERRGSTGRGHPGANAAVGASHLDQTRLLTEGGFGEDLAATIAAGGPLREGASGVGSKLEGLRHLAMLKRVL